MGDKKKLGRPPKKPKSIEVYEDYCFQCKDGGRLLLCDRKDCYKAYHPTCIEKDESVIDSGERWTCSWHRCSRCCRKSSDYRCFCCINALCRWCIPYEDFGCLRGSYGFCPECLELVKMIEEERKVSSDGEEINFDDRETYEGLFKEYWEIIRKKEGLTLDDFKYAEACMKKVNADKGLTYKSQSDTGACKDEPTKVSSNSHSPSCIHVHSDSDSEKSVQKRISIYEDKIIKITSDSDSDSDGSSYKFDPKQTPAKKRVRKRPAKHKKIGSSTREFVGWGSKPLLEFLGFIGKDTSQKISQDDACSIVIDYARDNKLFDPDKKKVILCDEWLYTLLGRKYSSIYKIKDFLESHFAENIEQSDADDQVPSSDDEDERAYLPASKLQRCSSSKRVQQKRSHLEDYLKKCDNSNEDSGHNVHSRVTFSRFASIIPNNLKLVYLKRSLLEELSKHPESFKDKVTGSFVKVKSNAIDYKHAYQLLPVTGVKNHSDDGTKINHCLTVASLQNDIMFSMLSNDDIIEEECEVLRQKVKDGLLERPSVVDLHKKAEILHVDITKHWIKRELAFLQHRIDHANEKGRRDLFYEYRQQKKLLENPEEQSRLLQEMPEVIADVIEDKKPSNSEESHQNESFESAGEKSIPEPLLEDQSRLLQEMPEVIADMIEDKKPIKSEKLHQSESFESAGDKHIPGALPQEQSRLLQEMAEMIADMIEDRKPSNSEESHQNESFESAGEKSIPEPLLEKQSPMLQKMPEVIADVIKDKNLNNSDESPQNKSSETAGEQSIAESLPHERSCLPQGMQEVIADVSENKKSSNLTGSHQNEISETAGLMRTQVEEK